MTFQRYKIIIKKGSSRIVILIGNYAFKFPYIFLWQNFLFGLIANINEVRFNRLKDSRLAPVVFWIPFGLFLVMKRANPLINFDKKLLTDFCLEKNGLVLPVELKKDSFGYINNKLVAIDYG